MSEHGPGHDAVEEALGLLSGLDERPVAEHVASYEAAHRRLREVLEDRGGH